MRPLLFILIMAFIGCISCSKNKVSGGSQQGISGQVLWFEGDLMPGPGKKLPEGEPVKRTVYIYDLISIPANSAAPFYQEFEQQPKVITETNDKGFFLAELPVGKYTVLVKEEQGLFTNIQDQNYLNPVQVFPDSLTQIELKVDYKAFY